MLEGGGKIGGGAFRAEARIETEPMTLSNVSVNIERTDAIFHARKEVVSKVCCNCDVNKVKKFCTHLWFLPMAIACVVEQGKCCGSGLDHCECSCSGKDECSKKAPGICKK